MMPALVNKRLAPVLGEEIARCLAAVCETHKAGCGGNVSIPSWVLVKIAESFVETLEAKT